MNEKKPLIIASAVLAFIIIAGGSALYYLHFVILPEKQKLLDDARKAVAEAKEKKNKIKGLMEGIAELQRQEKEKKARIPNLDSQEYDGLANLLDDIRKRASVEVSRGTYQTPRTTGGGGGRAPGKGGDAPATGVHKVQYDLNVKGAFHQLVRYLNLIEKEKRFIYVENFTVGRGTESAVGKSKGVQAMRDLKLTICSYTWREGATLAGQPATLVAEEKGAQSTPVPD